MLKLGLFDHQQKAAAWVQLGMAMTQMISSKVNEVSMAWAGANKINSLPPEKRNILENIVTYSIKHILVSYAKYNGHYYLRT